MFRQVAAPFGIKQDQDWRFFTAISTRPVVGQGVEHAGEGKLRLHYDPGIAMAFKAGPITDFAFWPVWDAIQCPVLVLRGANSDLLLPATAEEMTKRGPKATLAVIPDAGHAPALMEPSQIAIVQDWLAQK